MTEEHRRQADCRAYPAVRRRCRARASGSSGAPVARSIAAVDCELSVESRNTPRGVRSEMTAGVAVRDRRGRSIVTGSKSEMPATGSSREAAGIAGFLEAAVVEVDVEVVLPFAPVFEAVFVAVVFDELVVDLPPAFDVVVEVPLLAVADAAADFEVIPGLVFVVEPDPLIPRSFFTLLVTELTWLDMPPTSFWIEEPMSFASAIVFSNSPVSSADIRRKSRTSLPACPITSGSLPGPKMRSAATAMIPISQPPIPNTFIVSHPDSA